MSGRLITIGDVHGCSRALRALLAAVSPTSEDTIVTLGDVVDRGPDSRGTIEQLIRLSGLCKLRGVMGNHEEMMLAVLSRDSAPHRWVQFGGAATLDSYGFTGDLSVIPQDHVDFLASFVDYVETENHFFVHANYKPELPLSEQQSEWLRWRSLDDFLPGPHRSGKTAIVGHTADRTGEILSMRHLKCIDTYCYGGQWLTAYDVQSGQIWQANEEGQLRE